MCKGGAGASDTASTTMFSTQSVVLAAGVAVATALCVSAIVPSISSKRKEEEAESSDASPASVRNAEHADAKQPPTDRKLRVYMDGCFDLMHLGHYNALRQAKATGGHLIVGIHTDAEIAANKGTPPVIPYAERIASLRACKFVDEVVEEAPYSVDKPFLELLISKYAVDFIVHGDDPCLTADGEDTFAYVKSLGKYMNLKRTEGISTTDILGRLLALGGTPSDSAAAGAARSKSGSSFLATSRRFSIFSSLRMPRAEDKVVYIAGDWDLFHPGHLSALSAAKALGDFLLVGVYDDDTVSGEKGPQFPIIGLNERALSVLSCRHVDEVIIGAPLCISADMMTTMNISLVVAVEDPSRAPVSSEVYVVPAALGKFITIPADTSVSVDTIIRRVAEHRAAFTARAREKAAKEQKYITQQKQFVEEK